MWVAKIVTHSEINEYIYYNFGLTVNENHIALVL
jgi:hypothetical protein